MAPGNKALAVLNDIPPCDWRVAVNGAYVREAERMHKKTRTHSVLAEMIGGYFFLRTILRMIMMTIDDRDLKW